ncbi:lysophospholipid acyltransferase family protein [Pleomorphovibrio marinus]|uniref:lysophospholipid acyltransferase family protein n=1 Tax=Pleomorphovibrio marinus TaxID=2164132 RepID=UPI0018E59C07|nr:lysophospholipid acyltransferase family protein [Pleomorphovibrio marinus]
MSDLVKRIYSLYGTVIFFGTFFLLFPIFLLTIQVPGWKKYGRKLNRIWSKVFFSMLLIRVKFENLNLIKGHRQYVIVSNHFSYLDIPVLGLIPHDLVFVGKASLGKIPIFGYMFRNLHIAVDRNSLKSRGASIAKAKEAMDEGSSVVIFPEGGINSTHPPILSRFKDGAFRIAIDKQIPIIPITLSYNHLILPDDGRFLLRYKKAKVVIHPPIEVKGLDGKAIGKLKEKSHQVIQQQLLADNPAATIELLADTI